MSNFNQDIDDLLKLPKHKLIRRLGVGKVLPKKKPVDNSNTIVTLSERIAVLEKELQRLSMIVFATNKKYKHLTDSVNDGNHSKSSSVSK